MHEISSCVTHFNQDFTETVTTWHHPIFHRNVNLLWLESSFMNFWVLNFSSCLDADPYLLYLGRETLLPVCHHAYHRVFPPQTCSVLGKSLVPSWQWEFWFPNYTCEVPRGHKAMSLAQWGLGQPQVLLLLKTLKLQGFEEQQTLEGS